MATAPTAAAHGCPYFIPLPLEGASFPVLPTPEASLVCEFVGWALIASFAGLLASL